MIDKKQPYDLDSQLRFLSRLIRTGPIYGATASQQECAQEIASMLRKFAWDDVIVQNYTARDISDDPSYVPVHCFGKHYAEDLDRPKQNVIAVLNANRPGKTLILNGHYDVESVLDSTEWDNDWRSGVIDSDKVWGRGASDMLSGLTSQLYVASRFASNRDSWRGKIIFNAVTDEEIGGNGTLALLRELSEQGMIDEDSDISCLIAEPSNNVIALESLGFLHVVFAAHGKAQHMAGIELHDNVLYDIVNVISNLESILDQAVAEVDSLARNIKHVFGIIEGGIDAATPMPRVEAQATIFHPIDISANELKLAISSGISKITSKIETKFTNFCFSGQRSPVGDLYEALLLTNPSNSISTGIFPSPCDARLFSQFGINNVIIYGPGSLAQAHSPNEFIAIEDIRLYNRHLEAAISRYLGS